MAEEIVNAATPGPWIAGSGIKDGGYVGVWKKDTDRVFCRVSPIKTMNMSDIYNACLIASVPELLVAAKELVVATMQTPHTVSAARMRLIAAIDHAENPKQWR
jgi:hypothetical protein